MHVELTLHLNLDSSEICSVESNLLNAQTLVHFGCDTHTNFSDQLASRCQSFCPICFIIFMIFHKVWSLSTFWTAPQASAGNGFFMGKLVGVNRLYLKDSCTYLGGTQRGTGTGTKFGTYPSPSPTLNYTIFMEKMIKLYIDHKLYSLFLTLPFIIGQ